jgi:hypothetical protein
MANRDLPTKTLYYIKTYSQQNKQADAIDQINKILVK